MTTGRRATGDARGAAAAAARRGARTSLPRESLFLALFSLAALNSVSGQALRAAVEFGPIAAVTGLFGVSAVVWAALAAGIKILADERRVETARPADWWIAAMVSLAALLPSPTAAMAGLTLLAGWAIGTSGPGAPIRRAGIIFLAMSGALVWGRLVLAIFSGPLLAADAIFVSGLLGSEQSGNMLWNAGSSVRLVVAPGCSSMQGMSLALLFWATVNQLFQVPFGVRAALTCLAALAVTILINVLRIGAMLRFPAHLEEIHHGWGFHLSMWATLAAVAAICLWGARYDVFRRP